MTYTQEVIDEINKINIIQYISQYVELKKHGNIYIGVCPLHNDVNASLVIYPESNSYFCFGCHSGSSLINFTMKYHHLSFTNAIAHLIKYSQIDISQIKTEPVIVKCLKQFQINKEKPKVIHTLLDKKIMNQYTQSPIYEWIDEDINQSIMDKYQVRYDLKGNRIVFPIFDDNGNIISISGRTLYDNYKELGIRKYTYYTELGTNDFLYGLCFKRNIIKQKKEVILVEGAKSVWKLEGWGYDNAVAILTSHINSEQIKRILSLCCDVTIALDKNVTLDEIKKDCKPLFKFTNVFVIQDKHNFLGNKDAPVDKGKEKFYILYQERIKIN